MPVEFQPHSCNTPTGFYAVGTFWSCDECKKVWKLEYVTFGSRAWRTPMFQSRLRKRFGL